MKGAIPKQIAGIFGIALAIVSMNSLVSHYNTQKLIENERSVAHTHEVIANLEGTLSTLKDAETGQRGYLLTGNERYLQPYKTAKSQINQQIQTLQKLTHDNPLQQQRLTAVKESISKKLSELERTIQVSQQKGTSAARELVLSGNGIEIMDEIREKVAVMENTEKSLLQQRSLDSKLSAQSSLITLIIAGLLNIGLLLLLYYFIRRYTKERYQAEIAVRESEEKFRQLAENINNVFWISDIREGNLIYISPAYENIWGRSCESLYANPKVWIETIHPEDKQRIAAVTPQQIIEGEYDQEFRILRPDGTVRWIRDRGFPVKNANGKINRIAGIAEDITSSKQAQEAIKTSEAKLRGFVEANVIGILFGDIYGNVTEANDELLRIVGYTREDLHTGRLSWIDITPPEYLYLDERGIAEAQATGGCTPYEKEYIRKDQSRISVLVGYTLIGDKRDESVAFILDLSERKRMETEREFLLQEAQAARIEAERANQVKDEFLAVLSHELRSPLNPILGWSKLLRTRKLSEAKTAQALEIIERNAQIQTQLIEDLLDISRILQGKITLNMSPVNLASTIKAAMDTVQLAAEAKSMDLRFSLVNKVSPENADNIEYNNELDAGKCLVLGDFGRLQQIVWNLLSNAIKFTPERGRVEIKLSALKGNNLEISNYAEMEISDTGKGIKADFLPYVFEQFRQADSATTRQFGGLGLGLAIVRQLVELHGGTIQVESAGEGEGATFIVRLPVIRETGQSTQLNDKNARSNLPHSSLAQMQILVVDDDDDSRDFITFVLEQEGAQVTTATGAIEALKTLRNSRPDVILSDIGMPQIDGYELMRQIRALEPQEGGKIPAIAITAYASEIDHERAMAAGFGRHLAKPVEASNLIAMIVELVEKKNA